MASHEGYHEPLEDLSEKTRDMHRALVSLIEELEAVDWYNQRVDASKDEALRAILAHNRDEEKEHAAMVLEWIRRNDPSFDHILRTYLFTSGAITEIEEDATAAGSPEAWAHQSDSAQPQPRFTVGSLLGR